MMKLVDNNSYKYPLNALCKSEIMLEILFLKTKILDENFD